MTPLCLYVDDIRNPPAAYPERDKEGLRWHVARTFHEAIYMMERYNYSVISLDHDLGCYYGNKEMTGRDILNWLIVRKLDGEFAGNEIRVHSANPVGCATMEQDIQRYWGNT